MTLPWINPEKPKISPLSEPQSLEEQIDGYLTEVDRARKTLLFCGFLNAVLRPGEVSQPFYSDNLAADRPPGNVPFYTIACLENNLFELRLTDPLRTTNQGVAVIKSPANITLPPSEIQVESDIKLIIKFAEGTAIPKDGEGKDVEFENGKKLVFTYPKVIFNAPEVKIYRSGKGFTTKFIDVIVGNMTVRVEVPKAPDVKDLPQEYGDQLWEVMDEASQFIQQYIEVNGRILSPEQILAFEKAFTDEFRSF